MARAIVRPGLLEELATTGRSLTDQAMADIAHTSVDDYRAIRDGLKPPSWLFTLKICDAFGLGVGDVVVVTDSTDTAALAASSREVA